MTTVFAALTGGVVVTAAEPVIIPLLRRASIIDIPGMRSSHTVPTPRGGGAPIAAGLIAAAIIIHTSATAPFALAVAAFSLIGLADDIRRLPAGVRLVLQTLAAAAVAALSVGATSLPLPLLVTLGVVATVWMIGFVNAFNFMDGVNGISGAHAVIGGLTYACIGQWRPDEFLAASGLALAACALAFLPWNAVRARIFLGDVGSYGLGAALATLAAYSVLHGVPLEAATAPLALYLADTAWTLSRRIRGGDPWFEAHRTHTYQQWCDLGWSHQRITLLTSVGTILLVLLGTASLTPDLGLRIAADVAAAGVLVTYLGSPVLLRRVQIQPEAG